MDAFSYLSVVLSIVLGLGLTQLLTVLGRLVRHRDRVRVYWLPLLWAAILFLIYVQVWWSMFGLRLHRDWTFLAFTVVLGQTAILYMMAAVVLPEQVEPAGVDLREYYEQQHRWFFGLFLATLVVSIVKDVILSGRLPATDNLVFHGLVGSSCIAGLVARGQRVHQAIGIFAAMVIGAYISLLFTHLA